MTSVELFMSAHDHVRAAYRCCLESDERGSGETEKDKRIGIALMVFRIHLEMDSLDILRKPRWLNK